MSRVMSFILQCGHDALLLTTRELILKQDGFRVFNASDPIEAVRILSQKKIDLVLLCHTLSEHEFRAILANARLLPDAPKVLSLIPNTYPSFAPSAKIEIFNSLNVPGPYLRRFTDFSATTVVRRNPTTQAMERPMPKLTSTVRWFNNIKGYGFLGRDDGGPDVFVHYTAIESDGYKNPPRRRTSQL